MHLLLFNHIILDCYDPIFRLLRNTEFSSKVQVLTLVRVCKHISMKLVVTSYSLIGRVQDYFHPVGDDILLPSRYLDKVVTF
jgi:hypothetical protein